MMKTINSITLLFSCLSLSVFCELKSRSINIISQGLVRGYEDPEDGIFVFYNVPYATVPKGSNRFKAPLPAPAWEGTFEAIDRKIICPQSDLLGILPQNKVIEEDCLVANIYIPNSNEENISVVVYVHGGAFVVGWGDQFTFKQLVRIQKVIVVSFNYRLSAHGFLCLGTEDAPGNAGMKDQVSLLRWVRDNIARFGGNPHDVTLHGSSAGSSSVELFMLSKMANGLFKRVIADSGAGISTFTIQINPIENARKYAKLLGYDGKDDVYSLEHFYKNVSFDKLNSVQVINNADFILFMTPCVERDVGEEMFLDDSPINILTKGNYNKTPIDNLESERKTMTSQINLLTLKLENYERLYRKFSIEIRNVPKKPKESKSELFAMISKLNVTLNLNEKDITVHPRDVYRLPTKLNVANSTVIVELLNTLDKETVLRKVKFYSRNSSIQLNSEALGINGPKIPIYISEHLASHEKRLLFLAREFAKAEGYRYCWTSGGRVFLRKKENTSHILVKNEETLNAIKMNPSK